MKKVKKWGASLLTACLMIVMTAGCGGNAAPSGTSNQPAAAGGDSKPSYNFKLAHITPPTHMAFGGGKV
ncbi:hypothetical protein [Brevibacillus borstelensis]|uniref:hypothetical protein n=1 Tax=Brevibacillus borstelensis TaxID=45462 RepID=UPI0011742A01|nr:hypothetical protein [Brevibacillus borstelensis]GED52349.1 hypothetical protein BBO01nite_15900 [Brevibacillus borstelensis]